MPGTEYKTPKFCGKCGAILIEKLEPIKPTRFNFYSGKKQNKKIRICPNVKWWHQTDPILPWFHFGQYLGQVEIDENGREIVKP